MNVMKRIGYAMQGLHDAAVVDHSFRWQVIIAGCMVIAALLFCLPLHSWMLLAIAIGGVLTAELFNSALEELADHVQPTHHPSIRLAKDMAAAAVLVASFIALFIGMTVFLPVVLHGVVVACHAG